MNRNELHDLREEAPFSIFLGAMALMVAAYAVLVSLTLNA